MEEKSSDDEQNDGEVRQETKGFGDSTECGWVRGYLVSQAWGSTAVMEILAYK